MVFLYLTFVALWVINLILWIGSVFYAKKNVMPMIVLVITLNILALLMSVTGAFVSP